MKQNIDFFCTVLFFYFFLELFRNIFGSILVSHELGLYGFPNLKFYWLENQYVMAIL